MIKIKSKQQEHLFLNIMNTMIYMVDYEVREKAKLTPELKGIIGTVKQQGENKHQYGYYISKNVGYAILAMLKYDVKKVVDLGAGQGHVVRLFNQFGFEAKGFEIEKKLIKHSSNSFSLEHRDILKMRKSTLEPYDAVFFYEPFASDKLAKKFAYHLANVMKEGQYIFYDQAGRIGYYIEETEAFQRLRYRSRVQVFKKIK